jgi:hypothetical protein
MYRRRDFIGHMAASIAAATLPRVALAETPGMSRASAYAFSLRPPAIGANSR